MPPVPLIFDDDIQATIASLKRYQTDLSDFQIPRLRDCTGPLSLQQQYAVEVRDDLDNVGRLVERLELAVEDQQSRRDLATLSGLVHESKASLEKLRRDTRAALLTSKRAIDARAISSRDELLWSASSKEKPETDARGKATEDTLVKASGDVTEALRRTIGLMQTELERSVLSTQLLEDSTASLRSTSTVYDTMDNLMGTSKQLITALEKSDWLDRLVVLAALAFFLLVVAFILKQRIVDRGFRLAFWWTRFLPDFSVRSHYPVGAASLDKLERGEISASVTSIVASLITTTASAATMVGSSLTSQQDVPNEALEREQSAKDTFSNILDTITASSSQTGSLYLSALPTSATRDRGGEL